jgi:hypothetical protein
MKQPGEAQTLDAARRLLHEEPTLYEAQHAASAFGLELLSPEPISLSPISAEPSLPRTLVTRSSPPSHALPLDSFDEETQAQGGPAAAHASSATSSATGSGLASPWDEATHVPPTSARPTQTLPHVARGAIEHAAPPLLTAVGHSRPIVGTSSDAVGVLVTEVHALPAPSNPALDQQRRPSLSWRFLAGPFLVGTIGGICGLLLAVGGVRMVKQQRARERTAQLHALTEQQQLMEKATRALTSGRTQEARMLLWDYDQRWPSSAVRQMLHTLEQLDSGLRR